MVDRPPKKRHEPRIEALARDSAFTEVSTDVERTACQIWRLRFCMMRKKHRRKALSSASKSLLKVVTVQGQKMSTVDALILIDALPESIYLTTSEAAVFLRTSVSTLERLRKLEDVGPTFQQDLIPGAKGTNQPITYMKKHLIEWKKKNTVSSSLEAAIRKGQTFSTLMDIAKEEAFYVDPQGRVESMVEDNLVGTVIERLSLWDIVWLTPAEAAARSWSDAGRHQEFAAAVDKVLKSAREAIQTGLEASELEEKALPGKK